MTDAPVIPQSEVTQQIIGQEHVGLLKEGGSFGELVDSWADLVGGAADKAMPFKEAFYQTLAGHHYAGFKAGPEQIALSMAFLAKYREFEVVQFGTATVAVYMARIGDDLYVSWRSFIRGKLSWWKLAVFFIALILLPLPFSYGEHCATVVYYPSTRRLVCEDRLDYENHIVGVALAGIGAVLFFWFLGLLVRDPFARLRDKVHAFQLDDAIALGLVVHKSIIATADRVGIDSALLAPKESVFNQQRSSRKPRI